MNKNALLTSLCLVVGMLPLSAQQTEAGIQGSLVFPQSDLRSAVGARTGFEVGVHGAIDLQQGQELRPRIDYTRIDGGSFSLSSLSSTTTVSGISLGADYLCYLEQRRRGLYAVAGVGLVWWTSEYRFSGTTHETSPSLMIGAGHRFNTNVAMEFNVDLGKFRSTAGQASTIKAGIFYRF